MRSINTVLPSVRFCTFSFKYLSLTSSGLIFHNGNIIQQGRMRSKQASCINNLKSISFTPPPPPKAIKIKTCLVKSFWICFQVVFKITVIIHLLLFIIRKNIHENAFLFLQKLKGLNLKGMITVVINHSTYFNFCFWLI